MQTRAFDREDPVSKSNLLSIIEKPFKKAFTPHNIQAGFRLTGLHPFDPHAIKPAQMAPSAASAVNGWFPVPQRSPVKAIMTALDLCKRVPTLVPPTPPPFPLQSPQASPISNHIPLPPFPIDQYTQNEAAVTSTAALLLSSTSAAFLLDPSPAQYTENLPEPVLGRLPDLSEIALSPLRCPWRYQTREQLIQENQSLQHKLTAAHKIVKHQGQLIDAGNVQIALAGFHLQRQNAELFRKQNKKSKALNIYPGGKGQYMSHPRMTSMMAAHEEKTKESEAAKVARREERVAKAAGKMSEKDKKTMNKRLREVYYAEMEVWKAECDEALESGGSKSHPVFRRRPEWPFTGKRVGKQQRSKAKKRKEADVSAAESIAAEEFDGLSESEASMSENWSLMD